MLINRDRAEGGLGGLKCPPPTIFAKILPPPHSKTCCAVPDQGFIISFTACALQINENFRDWPITDLFSAFSYARDYEITSLILMSILSSWAWS